MPDRCYGPGFAKKPCSIARSCAPAGAEPNSDWLSGCVKLNPEGFVLTGESCSTERQLLETSRRGVFAIGDVRAGSVKRVAAAVGEGAQVLAMLHGFLAKPGP